jgi:hypothetical protein
MKRVWIAIAALVIGLAASFVGAPKAEAFCMQVVEGGPCGNCPELKLITVYCLQ